MTNGNDIKKFTFDSICQNDSQQDMFQKIGIKSTLNCLEGTAEFMQATIAQYSPMDRPGRGKHTP